jgi:type II secretory pathway pseudopilin PulG
MLRNHRSGTNAGNAAGPAGGAENGYSMLEVLMVVGITTVLAAMAVPMTSQTLGNFRLSGDARSLTNAAMLAKLRAASDFTQSRLYVDLNARTYHVETLQKNPAAWIADGGTTTLSWNVRFAWAGVATPPPNSQAAIGQAPACVTAAGAQIANTACVLFNSRGIPVDPVVGQPAPVVGAPTAADALYVTDNSAVYGLTLSATGLIKLWRTNPTVVPSWAMQ